MATTLVTPLTQLPSGTSLPIIDHIDLDDTQMFLGMLKSPFGPLPLTKVEMSTDIIDLVSTTKLTQHFVNDTDTDLEVSYVFPLPNRAAVTSFKATLAKRKIVGILKERARARQDYDAAVAKGQRAAITEQERSDVFTTRVGNIAPGESTAVTLTVVTPLQVEDGQATFRFPMVVAPRYTAGNPSATAPASDFATPVTDTDQVPDASRLAPPRLTTDQPRPSLNAKVTIHATDLQATDLHSSMPNLTKRDKTTGPLTVVLDPNTAMDRDLIIRFNIPPTFVHSALIVEDWAKPTAKSQSKAKSGVKSTLKTQGCTTVGELSDQPSPDQEGTWSLTLVPPPTTATPRRQVVIVLDRSGSMSGWKMIAARRAAARIIDSLSGTDTFAVIAFDNTIAYSPAPDILSSDTADQPPSPRLIPASDRNRFAATRWLSGLEARGGTEMTQPLLAATALLNSHLPTERVIVLVTDGQISGEDQLLGQLSAQLGNTRVHTVGIDRAVNAGFLDRLAKLGSGHSTLVESEDRLDEVMVNLHRRIVTPSLTDIQVSVLSSDSNIELIADTTTPARQPDAFAGIPCVLSGRYRRNPGKIGRVRFRVTATSHAGSVNYTLTPTLSHISAPTTIWARAHIAELEDQYVTAPSSKKSTLEAAIVGTSIAYGILSRFTAFVAIDKKSRNITDMRRVTQPVESPSGWINTAALNSAGPISAHMTMRHVVAQSNAYSLTEQLDNLSVPAALFTPSWAIAGTAEGYGYAGPPSVPTSVVASKDAQPRGGQWGITTPPSNTPLATPAHPGYPASNQPPFAQPPIGNLRLIVTAQTLQLAIARFQINSGASQLAALKAAIESTITAAKDLLHQAPPAHGTTDPTALSERGEAVQVLLRVLQLCSDNVSGHPPKPPSKTKLEQLIQALNHAVTATQKAELPYSPANRTPASPDQDE